MKKVFLQMLQKKKKRGIQNIEQHAAQCLHTCGHMDMHTNTRSLEPANEANTQF